MLRKLPPAGAGRIAFGCVLAAMVASALPAQKSRFGRDVLRDTTLENGLQVIAIRNPSAPFATVMVAFRAGAFTQASEQVEGLPHYIEHLIFKSYLRSNSASFGSHAGALGALTYNGTTGEELVNYYVVVPAKGVSGSIKLLSDLVRNPKFESKDMETEVQVVRNELERRISDQQFLLDFTVNQALWGPNWSRKNVGGNVFALMKSTPQSLESLYRTYYTPNNAALIVSGDISIDEVLKSAGQSFKAWKKGPATPPGDLQIQMTPLAATQVVTASGTASDITIQIAWHGPSIRSDSVGAMSAELFASLVNNRNSSFQRNLVDAGHFQSVSMSYRPRNFVGPVELSLRASPSQLVAGAAALQKELARLTDPAAFTEADLPLAKKYWRVDATREWEQGINFAHGVAEHWAVGGLGSFVGYGDGINARTAADVRTFVQTYLKGKPRIVGVLVSPDVRSTLGREFQLAMAGLTK